MAGSQRYLTTSPRVAGAIAFATFLGTATVFAALVASKGLPLPPREIQTLAWSLPAMFCASIILALTGWWPLHVLGQRPLPVAIGAGFLIAATGQLLFSLAAGLRADQLAALVGGSGVLGGGAGALLWRIAYRDTGLGDRTAAPVKHAALLAILRAVAACGCVILFGLFGVLAVLLLLFRGDNLSSTPNAAGDAWLEDVAIGQNGRAICVSAQTHGACNAWDGELFVRSGKGGNLDARWDGSDRVIIYIPQGVAPRRFEAQALGGRVRLVITHRRGDLPYRQWPPPD